MDRFAPWGLEWVERSDRAADDECPFCAAADQPDRESLVVARSDRSLVLLHDAPYNPGHVVVVPTPHETAYTALSPAAVADHARAERAAFAAIREAFDPAGLNSGTNHGDAGPDDASDHVHTHVVPRYTGDTNFMPVVSDTTVIVEAIDETYDHLREAFAELPCGRRPDDEDAAVEVSFE